MQKQKKRVIKNLCKKTKKSVVNLLQFVELFSNLF
jgi:hypothetical protein